MTPTQQTEAESHMGPRASMVSGAPVGEKEKGGICLYDLCLSVRAPEGGMCLGAGKWSLSLKVMAQDPQSQGSLFGLAPPSCSGLSLSSPTLPVPQGGQRGKTGLACWE